MFDILSIGDSAFLEQVFIGLAMVTGTGDFEQAVAIGLLVSAVFVTLASMVKPQEGPQFQQVLIAWVIYMVMFSPKVTLTIEDAYSGQLRPVANTPAGIAMVGTTFSNIGYGLTNLFETAFTFIVPYSTETPAMDPLKSMARLYRHADSPFLFSEMNKVAGAGADLKRSMVNYIKDCTMMKIETGVATPEEIERGDIDTAMFFDNGIYGTELFLGGTPQNVTCAQGWPLLEAAVEGSMAGPDFTEALRVEMQKGGDAAFDPLAELQGYQNMLTGAALSGKEVLETFLFDKLYDQAALSHYEDMMDTNMAIQYNDALVQRNLQWAAEGSMFKSVMRPLVTFLEGFFYAVSPFIMFAIAVSGARGVMLGVKYLVIGIWIQLWAPITALINLYLFMAVSGEMTSLTDANVDSSSMYAIDHIAHRAQHWIGVGGMLASAVPAIALAVLYGGAVSMGNLAGRFKSADHFNENNVVPEAMNRSAYAGADGVLSLHQGTGTAFAKGEESSISHGVNQSMKSAVASQQQHVASTKESATNALSQENIQQLSHSEQQAYSQSLGTTLSSSNSQTFQAAQQVASKISEGQNWTAAEQKSVAQSLAAQAAVSGGASIGPSQLKAAVNGSLSTGSQITENEAETMLRSYGGSFDQMNSTAQSEQSSLTDAKSAAWGQTFSASDVATDTTGVKSSINEQVQKYNESKEQLSRMQELSNSSSMEAKYGGHNLVGRLADPVQRTLGQMMQENPALQEQYNGLVQMNQDNHQNTTTAQTLAGLSIISNPNNYASHEEFTNAMAGINNGLYGSNHLQSVSDMTPSVNTNANIDRNAAEPTNLQDWRSKAELQSTIEGHHNGAANGIMGGAASGMPDLNPSMAPQGDQLSSGRSDVDLVLSNTGGQIADVASEGKQFAEDAIQGAKDALGARNTPPPAATFDETQSYADANRVTDSSEVPTASGGERRPNSSSSMMDRGD